MFVCVGVCVGVCVCVCVYEWQRVGVSKLGSIDVVFAWMCSLAEAVVAVYPMQ